MFPPLYSCKKENGNIFRPLMRGLFADLICRLLVLYKFLIVPAYKKDASRNILRAYIGWFSKINKINI